MKRLLLILGFLLLATNAHATRYWASSGGNNSAVCTDIDGEADPTPNYGSFARAVACATTSGDEVYVKAGTYTTNATISNPTSGITIRGESATPANWPVLQPTGTGVIGVSFTAARTNVTLKYLKWDFTNATTAQNAINVNAGYGAHNLTLEDFEILGPAAGSAASTASAIHCGSGNDNWTISRGKISRWRSSTSNPGAHGFYWSCNSGTISNVEVTDVNGYGIQLYSSGSSPSNNRLHSLYFHDSIGKGTVYFGSSSANNVVYNSILTNHDGTYSVNLQGTSNHIINNTIYDSAQGGIILTSCAGSCIVANNLIAVGGTAISGSDPQVTESTNKESGGAACMIDPANGNFNLVEGSACIDAGTVVAGSGLWPGSTGRYVGAGVDQGVFEAPIRSGAVVEDTDKNTYVITLSPPSQSTRDGVGLQGCTFGDFILRNDAGAPKTESACNIVGTSTVAVDVSDGDFTAGDLDDAYNRGTLRDNSAIGDPNGVEGTNFFNAYVRTWAATAGTNNVGSAPTGAYEVVHYRCLSWYSDTSPAATDFLRAEDAPTTTLACPLRPGGLGAVVIALARNTDDVPSQSFEWHFNRNAGGYGALTNTTSATAIAFAGANAPSMSDGAATGTVILTNPHATYIAGQVVAQQTSQPTIDFSADSTTNIILLVKSDAASTVGDTYCLQPALTGQAVSSITQTATPCFQIVYPSMGM